MADVVTRTVILAVTFKEKLSGPSETDDLNLTPAGLFSRHWFEEVFVRVARNNDWITNVEVVMLTEQGEVV